MKITSIKDSGIQIREKKEEKQKSCIYCLYDRKSIE